MTIKLDLKPETHARLVTRAREEGLPVESVISRAIEKLFTGIPEDEPDYIEEEPPVARPKFVREIKVRLVHAGQLVLPPIDEADWID